MQSVLDAVLSETSTPQIGFCGMGGIGKTTVSSWVAHNDDVRTRFGMIAWISLGQTPILDACINLLYLQLKGAELADSLSSDQKHEYLKQAFLNRSVLLVLDDCWDAEVATHFKWIDPNTNSKILISSRVRNVLDGGEIIDVTIPSKTDAIKMLLSTADMDSEALQTRKEVAQIAELCKRLPLTIGVAGKLIKEATHGHRMTDASDWVDVVELLQSELDDPDGDLSIEESVIRASIKSIPAKIRKQVTQLFNGFALVPEDTHVPLPVLGMIYDACGNLNDDESSKKTVTHKPISRMQIRNYLKVLIDRSLVLGTVDRPQLHDVMLEYVKKELVGEQYKAAQRKFVDAFRQTDRSPSSVTGTYLHVCIKHHITESYDEVWGKSPQAMSWLEAHVNGIPDIITFATASVLPDVHALAIEAEALENWWSAALRWNAIAFKKMSDLGVMGAGHDLLEHAVKVAANISVQNDVDASAPRRHTQFELDSFNLNAMSTIVFTWDPVDAATYGERIRKLAVTEAGRSRPVLLARVVYICEWFPAMLSCDVDLYCATNWKLTKMFLDMSDPNTDLYSRLTEEERLMTKPMVMGSLFICGDAMMHTPGFTLEYYGENGDRLLECAEAYNYQTHNDYISNAFSCDMSLAYGVDWVLTLQYGRVSDSGYLLGLRRIAFEKAVSDTSSRTRSNNSFIALFNLLTTHHIHGLPNGVRKTLEILGITFDSASVFLSDLTRDNSLSSARC
jgi:hypothetical protein